MVKKYTNTPIIEALCEFQFLPGQEWDMTLPGLLYQEIKEEFPNKHQQMGVGVQFRPTEKGLEHKVEQAPPRIQFHRKDKTALVQVAPDLLVINQLAPYPTWTMFKPVISDIFKKYIGLANPKGFKRIGLRYINKLIFPPEPVMLEEYFNFYPYIPKDLPQIHTSFISRAELLYFNERDRLIITISNAIPEPPKVPIILDLDYIMIEQEGIPMGACEEWLEQAHSAVEKAFEACITEKSRILFGEVL